MLGDFNFDGIVNAQDLSVFGGHWQQTIAGGASVGDFNNDGIVNALDLSIFGGNWQQSWTNGLVTGNASLGLLPAVAMEQMLALDPALGSASSTPEPTSLGLLALGGIALLNRRRKA